MLRFLCWTESAAKNVSAWPRDVRFEHRLYSASPRNIGKRNGPKTRARFNSRTLRTKSSTLPQNLKTFQSRFTVNILYTHAASIVLTVIISYKIKRRFAIAVHLEWIALQNSLTSLLRANVRPETGCVQDADARDAYGCPLIRSLLYTLVLKNRIGADLWWRSGNGRGWVGNEPRKNRKNKLYSTPRRLEDRRTVAVGLGLGK